MTSTGTMTAAERRDPVKMLARSSIPAVPRLNGQVSERSRNGESSAVPAISRMTISATDFGSVAADGKASATTASAAIPQHTATRPPSSRSRPIRLGSTTASRSASAGPDRPGAHGGHQHGQHRDSDAGQEGDPQGRPPRPP